MKIMITFVSTIVALAMLTGVGHAGRVPDADFDGGYSCDQAGGSTVVWVTREYRWPGRVKIWDGRPFVGSHLRRVIEYGDLKNDGPEGGIVIGELANGVHRLRSTYHQRVLDRVRIRVRCS